MKKIITFFIIITLSGYMIQSFALAPPTNQDEIRNLIQGEWIDKNGTVIEVKDNKVYVKKPTSNPDDFNRFYNAGDLIQVLDLGRSRNDPMDHNDRNSEGWTARFPGTSYKIGYDRAHNKNGQLDEVVHEWTGVLTYQPLNPQDPTFKGSKLHKVPHYYFMGGYERSEFIKMKYPDLKF